MSLSDGTITNDLLSRPDADVEYVIKDINRVAYGVIYSGFSPSYSFFDSELDRRMQEIQALFPEHSVWLRDWSDDWKNLVIYVEGPQAPGDYYLFSVGKEPRFLTSARPNIRSEDVNPIAIVSIKASDGLEIPTILTVPRDKVEAPRKLPAIMLPHGGPQSYDRVDFDWMAQAFASQGYLVIQPQFRGSDGFGAKHLSAGYGEWGKKMQQDLSDSLDYLVRGNIVDESRVCTVGGSYGGYAALAGGAFTPELYRCVVSLNGVSDLPGMLSYERNRYGRKHWIVSYFENFMVEGEATKDKLNAISPVNFAENFAAPVLLIHGENDETVPFDQSDEMYDHLRSAGKDVQLIKLKNENHGLMNGENRLEALERMIAFVNQHIGDN
jgi:dipeptidyl aminopeptidase/acylaminoacyl peptidase